MDVKFTPGPWIATQRRGDDERCIQIKAADGTYVAAVNTFTTPADNNLIAAAPELYEALRKLSFAAQTTGGTPGRDDALCAAIDEATAALAKARGEQAFSSSLWSRSDEPR